MFLRLNKKGMPCIFYLDYYGDVFYKEKSCFVVNPMKNWIDKLLIIRKYIPDCEYKMHVFEDNVLGWGFIDKQNPTIYFLVLVCRGKEFSCRLKLSHKEAEYFDISQNALSTHVRVSGHYGEFGVIRNKCAIFTSKPIYFQVKKENLI